MKKMIAAVLVLAALITTSAFADTSCETIAFAISSADAMDACSQLCDSISSSDADTAVTSIGPNCIAINLDEITDSPDSEYLRVFSRCYNK